VYGDSMEPTFCHGDYVYCSYVETGNLQDLIYRIRNEYVYVVNTKRALFLKRVYYHYGDDFLQLYSDKYKSSGDKKYAAFPIPLDEIRELWYFRRRYTAQAPQPDTANKEIIDIRRDVYNNSLEIQHLRTDLGSIINKLK
jgi:signal peptidase I